MSYALAMGTNDYMCLIVEYVSMNAHNPAAPQSIFCVE